MGIDQSKVDALLARARREVDDGLLPSTQVALAYQGELVAFEAYGDANLETRYAAFSATKAFVASTVWTLIGEGLVDPSKLVIEYIPEFGTNGKDVITVEQVMLHTAGFPHAPLAAPQWWTREGRVTRFGEWRLNWEPGTRYEYHATSAHWVLGEIIDRVTGGNFCDELEKRVTGPIGLPRVLGIEKDAQTNVATLVAVGEHATPDELEATFGIRELPVTEVTEAALLGFNHPDVKALGVPGGGGLMRAADLALFYQALLHNPGGVWKPDVLADVTSNVRNRLPDPMTNTPGEPQPRAHPRRRRRPLTHPRNGSHGVARHVRAQRRGRTARLGRPCHRAVVRLLHERPRRERGPRASPRHRPQQPRRRLHHLAAFLGAWAPLMARSAKNPVWANRRAT